MTDAENPYNAGKTVVVEQVMKMPVVDKKARLVHGEYFSD